MTESRRSPPPLPVLSPGGPADVIYADELNDGKIDVPANFGNESRLGMTVAGLVLAIAGLVGIFLIGHSLFHSNDFSEQRFNVMIASTVAVVVMLVGGFILLIRPNTHGTTSAIVSVIGTAVSTIAGVLLTGLIVVVFACAGLWAMFVTMFQTCFGG